MEVRAVRNNIIKIKAAGCWIILFIIAGIYSIAAQSAGNRYIVKDGKMQIELSKHLNEAALDSFIAKFDLFDLDLKQLIKTNGTDSLKKLGWKFEKNNRDKLIISKLLIGYDNFNNPAEKIMFAEKMRPTSELFPSVNNDIQYGFNNFRRKSPFLVRDAVVTFFLRNNSRAHKVMLAGSFNDWNPRALPMKQTDSGWIADVELAPGKYWYKFIVDNNWTIDNDNTRVENDGRGNDNSVFYKPNITFTLNGFENANKVFLAGSFNNWKPRELLMVKTTAGWQLPIYLAEGTHTYRFVADGQWMTDRENKERLPNEFGEFNSVVRIGKPYIFKLNGYTNANKVVLAGSFNKWRENELYMNRTATGWELRYTLGPGNYEYGIKADGKWITGAEQTMQDAKKDFKASATIIIGPNYTFRLRGFNTAKTVFLSGDLNHWSPDSYPMKKADDGWVLNVHLSSGKHLYKFVVDGKWIKDPENSFWEQNEYGTGNSVIWFSK